MNEKIVWLLSLIVSIFLTGKCIRKYYVERVKNFIKCEPIPTNYLIFKVREIDAIFICLITLMLYSLNNLGLLGEQYHNVLVLSWFASAVICCVGNVLMEARQYNSYLILELLSEKGELSIDDLTTLSNGLLEGERFYFALKPLLKAEMVSTYCCGTLTEDKVLYQITSTGRANYQNYLILESEKLEVEMFKIRRKLNQGIGNSPLLEMQYDQAFEKLISTKKKIITGANNSWG
jgi:hypothetical protein